MVPPAEGTTVPAIPVENRPENPRRAPRQAQYTQTGPPTQNVDPFPVTVGREKGYLGTFANPRHSIVHQQPSSAGTQHPNEQRDGYQPRTQRAPKTVRPGNGLAPGKWNVMGRGRQPFTSQMRGRNTSQSRQFPLAHSSHPQGPLGQARAQQQDSSSFVQQPWSGGPQVPFWPIPQPQYPPVYQSPQNQGPQNQAQVPLNQFPQNGWPPLPPT